MKALLFGYDDEEDSLQQQQQQQPQQQDKQPEDKPQQQDKPQRQRQHIFVSTSFLMNKSVFELVCSHDDMSDQRRIEGVRPIPSRLAKCPDSSGFLLISSRFVFVYRDALDNSPLRMLHFPDGKFPSSCTMLSSDAYVLGFSFSSSVFLIRSESDGTSHSHHPLNENAFLTDSTVVAVKTFPGSSVLVWLAFSNGLVFLCDTRFGSDQEYRSKKEMFYQEKPEANPRASFFNSVRRVTDMDVSPNGLLVAVSGACGNVHVTRINNAQNFCPEASFKVFYGAALCVQFSPDSRLLAAGGEDDLISVYDIQRGSLIYRLEGHIGFVHRIAFLPDSNNNSSYDLFSIDETQLRQFSISLDNNDNKHKTEGEFSQVGCPSKQQVPIIRSNLFTKLGSSSNRLSDVSFTSPNTMALVHAHGVCNMYKREDL